MDENAQFENCLTITSNDRSQKFSQKLVDFGMFFVFPKKSFARPKHGACTLIFRNRIGMALILGTKLGKKFIFGTTFGIILFGNGFGVLLFMVNWSMFTKLRSILSRAIDQLLLHGSSYC
jgi:hypothetical protein